MAAFSPLDVRPKEAVPNEVDDAEVTFHVEVVREVSRAEALKPVETFEGVTFDVHHIVYVVIDHSKRHQHNVECRKNPHWD